MAELPMRAVLHQALLSDLKETVHYYPTVWAFYSPVF